MTLCEKCREGARYNGWANYETWCVNLWLGNEEPTQRYWQGRADDWAAEPSTSEHWSQAESAKFNLADELKESIALEAAIERVGPDIGMFVDLLGAAMSEVDWHEIAAGMLEGLVPIEAKGDR